MTFASLSLPPGIERNATPYDTPGRWWDMNLIRWQAGTLRPIGGWQRSTSTPLDSNARNINVYRDNSNGRHIIVGTDAKLYTDAGGTFTDITPTSFTPLTSIGTGGGYGTFEYNNYPGGTPGNTYGTARPYPSPIYSPSAFWSMSNWGEDLILTANSDGRLFYYTTSTATNKPVVINGAPTANNSVIVTGERHCMAIGCGSYPRRVGWSSREDYTDWNFASTTNTAGYVDTDARTPLSRAVRVREGVLIFSQSEAYLARYVGLPFIYGIDRIADTTLINPMAVATYNGKAAWMGRNGFWKYDGGFLQPLDCPVLNDIFSNIDPDYGPFRSHAAHNGTFPEIWFFYPTVGNTECNRYVMWNYMENWWAWGSLSRTAVAPGETYIRPYMGGTDGNIYEHEYGYTAAGAPLGSSGQVWAESGMLPLSNGDRGVNINSVLPASGYGYNTMNIRFYSRQTPEGAELTFGPYNTRPDGYTDCRVSGRDVRIRIEQTVDDDWSIGKFRFDVQPGSGR